MSVLEENLIEAAKPETRPEIPRPARVTTDRFRSKHDHVLKKT